MLELNVPVKLLCKGLFVRIDLPLFKRGFMRKSFLITSEKQIAKIQSLGLKKVPIMLEKCTQLPQSIERLKDGPPKRRKKEETQPKPPVFSALKDIKIRQQEWHKERKKQYQQCEKRYRKTFGEVSGIIRRVTGYAADAVEDAADVVGSMVDVFLSDNNVVLNLINMKGAEERYQLHCMNVTVLSMMIGRRMRLDPEAMQHLGMGALFHDIGKEMMRKGGLMDERARHNIYKQHPLVGQALADRIHTFPEEVSTIILQHHEWMNGKGFPKGLKGEEIDSLARIVAIADVYDNLCNDRDDEKRITPHEALARVFKARSRFDMKYLEGFVRNMGIYPPGSVVQLSNNDIGMVVTVDPAKPMLPSVMLYNANIPKNEAVVLDLGNEEGDLKVAKNLSPGDLPREIYAYLNPGRMAGYSPDVVG